MNHAEKAWLLDNPELFILHYFPQIEELQEFHLRLIDNAAHAHRGLILFPAAHGKTTLTSLLVIWAVCKDPNIRIGLMAKNDKEARALSRAIQEEMLENMPLIRDFGPFREEESEKAWNLDRFDVAKRTRRGKEATVGVFGAKANDALGYRTDWSIVDDIITEKNSASPAERETLRAWFNTATRTMPHRATSRMTVVGTLFDPEDLYHDLMEQLHPETGDTIWQIMREEAIVRVCDCGHEQRLHHRWELACSEQCDCQVFVEDEEEKRVLWPEIWPYNRLMAEKAGIGTLAFNKRYLNIAVDPSRMVFKNEYVRGGYIGKERYPGCLDKYHAVGAYSESWPRYAGFDPAVSITRHAKFCAHITIAIGSCAEHERCYWIIDLIRDQMTLPQQADLIIAQHRKYGLLSTRLEANSYQGGLKQIVDERMEQRGLALRVEPHFTTRVNKPDPEIGLPAMGPWFEKGAVHIPQADLESRRKMTVFIDELVQYPGRTTDTVLALWFAWLAAEERNQISVSFNRLTSPARPLYKGWTRRHVVRNPAYVEEADPANVEETA